MPLGLVRLQGTADGQVLATGVFRRAGIAAEAAGGIALAQPVNRLAPENIGNPGTLKAEVLDTGAGPFPQQCLHPVGEGGAFGQRGGGVGRGEAETHCVQQAPVVRGGQAFPVHLALLPGQGRRGIALVVKGQGQDFQFVVAGQFRGAATEGAGVQVQVGGGGNARVATLPLGRQLVGQRQQGAVGENLGDKAGGIAAALVLELHVGKQFVYVPGLQLDAQGFRKGNAHFRQPVELVCRVFADQLRLQGQGVKVGVSAGVGQPDFGPAVLFEQQVRVAFSLGQVAIGGGGKEVGFYQVGEGLGGVVVRSPFCWVRRDFGSRCFQFALRWWNRSGFAGWRCCGFGRGFGNFRDWHNGGCRFGWDGGGCGSS